MDMSVVVATWNNSRLLARTLGAFSRCHVPSDLSWQVVVVNNNCTDDTDDAVMSAAEHLPICYVHEPVQGLSRARNAGIRMAEGQLIVFTDDDVNPCIEWLAVYWSRYVGEPTNCFFGGPIVSDFEGAQPDADLISLGPPSIRGLWLGPDEHELRPGEDFLAANWACPRESIEEVGGFREDLGLNTTSGLAAVGEETELMARLRSAGYRPVYLPSATLAHYVPLRKCTLKHIAARAEANGAYHATVHPIPCDGRTALGVPFYWWRRLIELRWNYLTARAKGHSGYAEYIAYRKCQGLVRGMRLAASRHKRASCPK